MKRSIFILLVLMLSIFMVGCSLLPSDDGESEATTPTEDEAKTLYTESSTALYNNIDPEDERGLSKRLSKAAETINHPISITNQNGITMTGGITGTVNFTPPSGAPTPNTTISPFMQASFTLTLDGAIAESTITDPEDSTKQYVISSGTIHQEMSQSTNMDLVIDNNLSMTPSGSFDFKLEITTEYKATRVSDGKAAKFVLTYSKDPPQINLASPGGGGGGGGGGYPNPNGGCFASEVADLKVYDLEGTLLYTTTIPLEDTPWAMSDFMSNAMGGGGSGGGI